MGHIVAKQFIWIGHLAIRSDKDKVWMIRMEEWKPKGVRRPKITLNRYGEMSEIMRHEIDKFSTKQVQAKINAEEASIGSRL